MSKILKRPMFRKGGSVNQGVMTGLTDRNKYDIGGRVEERMKLLERFAPAPRSDALSNLLIRGGLRLVGGVGAGDSTIQAVAKSFAEPTEQFMKEKGETDKYRSQLGLLAATGVLGEEQAYKIAALKAKGTMQKEMRIAIANLNRRGIKNPSEDQILNEVSRVAMQTEERFETSLRENRLNKLLENPQIRTRLQASMADNFEQLIGTKIPASKVQPQYILRKDKKGNIVSTQLSKPGIYLDIDTPGGRIIEIINGQSKDITAQYLKKQ